MHLPPTRVATAAVALMLLTGAAQAAAAAPQLSREDSSASGQHAIDLLGSKLPDAAAAHKRTAEDFRAMLLRDKYLRLDASGRVYAVDTLEQPLPKAPDVGPEAAPGPPPAPHPG